MACYVGTFFHHDPFFPLKDKTRETEKGDFAWLRTVGFFGVAFLSRNVNEKTPQPLLREAVESSYVDS